MVSLPGRSRLPADFRFQGHRSHVVSQHLSKILNKDVKTLIIIGNSGVKTQSLEIGMLIS
jgi:hypothetical protein